MERWRLYGEIMMLKTDTYIDKDELERLQRCEQILWEVESSLPSGLESWISDEELDKLRV